MVDVEQKCFGAQREREAKVKRATDRARGDSIIENNYLGVAESLVGFGIYVHDLDAKRFFVSSHCKSLLGLPLDSPASIDETAWLSAVDPHDREELCYGWGTSTASPTHLRWRIAHSGTSPRYVEDRRCVIAPTADTDQKLAVGALVELAAPPKEADSNTPLAFNLDGYSYRKLFNYISESIIFADIQRRIVVVNDSFTTLFGYTAEEVIGRTTEFLYETREAFLELDRQYFHAGISPDTAPFETRYRRKNGTLFWVETRATTLVDQTGNVIGFLGIHRDISERKRAHAVLVENEAREHRRAADRAQIEATMEESARREAARAEELATLMEAVPAAVYIAQDPDCKTVTANRAGYELLHLPLGSNISTVAETAELPESARILKNGVDVAPENMPLRRAAQGEYVGGYDVELAFQDGSSRFMLGNAVPLYDPQRQPRGAIAVFVDVTDIKRNQGMLAQFAAIVETSTDAIFSTDAEDRFTSWNPGAERMFGYTSAEVIGKHFTLLVPDELCEEQQEMQARLMAGQRVGPVDTLRKHKSGEALHISLAISPLFSDCGERMGSAVIARDISDRKRMEEQLHRDAFFDKLTGLPNRRLFVDRLAHAIAHADRGQEEYAVLVLDIDNFKLINDSLGHLAGDRLLCGFADRIQKGLRPTDTMARFGGDEFTILLEQVNGLEGAIQAAERILQALAEPFMLEGALIHVSSSIGITLSSADYARAEEALRDADTALYKAKRRGKSRYAVFDSSMRSEVVSRLFLETELRQAVEQCAIQVAYQPIVDIRSDRVAGCEVLARWQHPTLGSISPARFIHVAEETGMIVPLGHNVLDCACRDLARWLRDPHVHCDFYISVNLSPREFLQRDLVQGVSVLLQRYGLGGEHLRFEITESVLIEHDREAASTLHALKEIGVQICMDDFGTGYSSLSYLHQFPIDVIKVDRSFVNGMSERRERQEIVRTILGLARTLEMQPIAEGAETPQQLQQLKELGFRWVQGFGLYRPMNSRSMSTLLATMH